MMTEKEFITFLTSTNGRYLFVLPDKNVLPTLNEVVADKEKTHAQIATAKRDYWQIVKDYATLHMLEKIIETYTDSQENNVYLDTHILESFLDAAEKPCDMQFARNFRAYVDAHK